MQTPAQAAVSKWYLPSAGHVPGAPAQIGLNLFYDFRTVGWHQAYFLVQYLIGLGQHPFMLRGPSIKLALHMKQQ